MAKTLIIIILSLITCCCLSSPHTSRLSYHHATSRSSSRKPKIEEAVIQEDPNLPHKRLLIAINKFSNRLYNVLNDYKTDHEYDEYETSPSSEDLIYSPITVFTSLSTLHSGTRAETRQELSTILSISKINDTIIQNGLNSILQTYSPNDQEARVNLLNRVFLDHSFHPIEDYSNTVSDKFHGELVQTHFSNATAASIFVNKHVKIASHGVLQDIISVDGLEGEGVTASPGNSSLLPPQQQTQAIDGGLMLISGLTFEGDFERPFSPLMTRKDYFTREDGSRVEVDMMHRDGVYLYAEIPELNATVLSIVYKDHRYSLNVLLPEENISIAQLEENCETFPFIAVMSRLKKAYMQVSLPRFAVETTVDLIDPLEKLGVKRLFNEHSAQLTRLADGADGDLYLTNAVHKVVLDVREGGSRVRSQNFIEAIPMSPRIITPYTVNRPFVFFISDQLLNAVLMVGRKAV